MARFGKRAVMGSRVLVGTKSHKCFGGFVDKAVFESDVLVGTISQCFGGSLWREGSFRESCVGVARRFFSEVVCWWERRHSV